ncbi:unnamed protein product, partial [Rotaria sp. Silwood2]
MHLPVLHSIALKELINQILSAHPFLHNSVSLHDERPFEHEFFLRIAQSFPFMKELTLINKKPQKNKLNNENQDLLIIKYPHLTKLN